MGTMSTKPMAAVFGFRGLLGSHVCNSLALRYDVKKVDADVCDGGIALGIVKDLGMVKLVVNCAAYTNMDEAELYPHRAIAVNAIGASNVAVAASAVDATLVHYSTDAVFDGLDGLHKETTVPCPRGAYSMSKFAGEEAVRRLCTKTIIIRTAHLYGRGGKNNASNMLDNLRAGKVVYADPERLVTPTWAQCVANRTLNLLDYGIKQGVYHAVNGGAPPTWYQFASSMVEAIRTGAVEPRVVSGPAPRPKHSLLSDRNTPPSISKMVTWGAAQRLYLASEGLL